MTDRHEGREFALNLLAKIDQLGAANAALLGKYSQLVQRMDQQQSLTKALSSQVQSMIRINGQIATKLDAVAEAALDLDPEEWSEAQRRVIPAGLARQAGGAIINGLFGGWHPGQPDPRRRHR